MNVKTVIGICVLVVIVGSVLVPAIDMTDDPKILEVLIIDGQSNAEYGDRYVCDPEVVNQEYPVTPSRNLYYYGTSSAPGNQWDWSHQLNRSWAAYHLHEMHDGDKWTIGGYEPILGNTIAEKSGRDVLVINMGIGARSIKMLLPDGADGDFSWGVLDHALAQARRAYDAIDIVGVVWIQGESDKDTPVPEYVSSFNALSEAFKGYGADRFYLVHTRDYFGGNANIAQEQIAADNDNVEICAYITESFTQANGMLASNADIHYSQKGRDAIAFELTNYIVVHPVDVGRYAGGILYIIPVVIIAAVLALVARSIISNRD